MIDVKPQVLSHVNNKISESGFKYPVYWIGPKKGDTLPCIIYNEIENYDYIRVSGNEYAYITIQFTMFSVKEYPEHIFMMASILDDAMVNDLGFKKTYSAPANFDNQSGVFSQVLRFSAIIDHNLNVYKN